MIDVYNNEQFEREFEKAQKEGRLDEFLKMQDLEAKILNNMGHDLTEYVDKSQKVTQEYETPNEAEEIKEKAEKLVEEQKNNTFVKRFINSEIPDFILSCLAFPFVFVYELFKTYVEDITILKGFVLFFFALTTLFCGWLAFEKGVYEVCVMLNMIPPFDEHIGVTWLHVVVIWLAPFLLHIGLKILIPLLMFFVIALVLIVLITGDQSIVDKVFSVIAIQP